MQNVSNVAASMLARPAFKSADQLAAEFNDLLSSIGNNCLVDCNIDPGRKKADSTAVINKFIETQVNDQFLCIEQSKLGISRPRLLRTSGTVAGQYVEPRLWYTRLPMGNYSFQALYYTTPISSRGVCANDLNAVEAMLRRFVDVAVSSEVVLQEILAARPTRSPKSKQHKPRYTMRQLLSLQFD